MHHSGTTRRSGAGRGLLLRCCLLLAIWQGPLPWCHCHGVLRADESPSTVTLAAHLQSFHRVVTPYAETTGWHWHFLPDPADPDSTDAPDRDDARVPSRLVCDSLAEVLSSLLRPAVATSVAELDAQRGPTANVAAASEVAVHFYLTFAPTLPMPLRFSVARC
jgi:hypothetical protein